MFFPHKVSYGGDYMSEYRRFVSYIYEYENDTKGRNVGFAKVEVRQGQKRVDITLRRVPGPEGNALKVSGFYREEGKCVKKELGRMALSGGNGNFHWSSAAEFIGDNCSFSSLVGLAICPEYRSENVYVTVWDDEPFSTQMLTVENNEVVLKAADVEEVEKESKVVEIAVQLAEPEVGANYGERQRTSSSMRPKTAEQSLKMNFTNPQPRMVYVPKSEITEPGNEETQEYEKEVESEHSPIGTEIQEEEGPLEVDGDTNSEEAKEWFQENVYNQSKDSHEREDYVYYQEAPKTLWDKLCTLYPKVNPFPYAKGMVCLKIKPGDIGRLPKENWILGNNSFLLHGYFQYRYLILVRQKQDDQIRYILGVPGALNNNDKFMANMFGFNDFMPAQRNDPSPGSFGYWCMNVSVE